jgi:hypothetical protein
MKLFNCLVFLLILNGFLLTGCSLFRKQPPQKDFFEKTYEIAHSELKSKKEDNAENLFREIYQVGRDIAPEYSTASLFELAKLNEKRGEFELALSQLKELEGKKSWLAKIKAELELPARLAGVYAALGQIRASENYAAQAEKGLSAYSTQIRPDQNPQWWAETYYRMSSLPLESLDSNNWEAFAKRFEASLPFLIRSMEYADPLWSQRSLTTAETFFKRTIELAGFTQEVSDENWYISLEDSKARLDRLDYLNRKSQLWKTEGPNQSRWSRGYYTYLLDVEKLISKMRRELPESAPFSKESAKKKEIKRTDIELKTIDMQEMKQNP